MKNIKNWSSNVFYNDKCIIYRTTLDIVTGEIKNYFLLNLRWVTQNYLLKEADGSILIEMKGFVLCVSK